MLEVLQEQDVMSETEEERRKREVARLKQKTEDSQVNVVKKVMNQPEVRHVIKLEINKQMFISGLFMSFFLVGFFQIFNTMKTLFQYDWRVDMIIGAVLVALGALYTAKQILTK